MISSGTYTQISIEQVIASAKMQLKIETTDQDIWFEKIANQGAGPTGLRAISTFTKKQCQLNVVSGKAKLPKGFNQLIALRYNANSDAAQPNSNLNCAPMLYVDMGFLNNCGCNTNIPFVQNSKGVFQINGGHVIFYGGVPDGTEVSIAYFGNNVDENGLQMIYERYERALTAFICYFYTLQNANEYNQYVIESYRQEWMAQKRLVRSMDVRESFNNTKYQLMEISNALITDKSWAFQATQ
jgi:hypothetical protein